MVHLFSPTGYTHGCSVQSIGSPVYDVYSGKEAVLLGEEKKKTTGLGTHPALFREVWDSPEVTARGKEAVLLGVEAVVDA